MRIISATESERVPWSNEYMIWNRPIWLPHSYIQLFIWVTEACMVHYPMYCEVYNWLLFMMENSLEQGFFYHVCSGFQHTYTRQVDCRAKLSTALRKSSKDCVCLWGVRGWGVLEDQGKPPGLQPCWPLVVVVVVVKFLKPALHFLLSRHSHRHLVFSPFLFARPTSFPSIPFLR